MTEHQISAQRARKDLARLIEGVQWRKHHYTIVRYGRPVAVVVPTDWYDRARSAEETD